MENLQIAFSLYTDVPKKQVEQEIARQQTLLSALAAAEQTDEVIAAATQVQENIRLLQTKRKNIIGKNVGSVVSSIFKWIMWAILIVYCISLLFLPVWMLLTAFKDPIEYTLNPFAFPTSFKFDNFVNVFSHLQIEIDYQTSYNMLQMAGFSFLYAAGFTVVDLFLTAISAYVIAKYRFPGRNLLYTIGIVVMIVPIVGSLPSAMQINKALGVYDNMLLRILLCHGCVFSGFNFLLLHGNFKEMPWDYAEAVFIDGGNHYTAFFKMYLPMIFPTLMVLFVLGFLGGWNDYETFMVWLPSTPNLAYGMYLFQGKAKALYKSNITEVMAGFTMVVIPTVALYFASQKTIMSKYTVGGLKG